MFVWAADFRKTAIPSEHDLTMRAVHVLNFQELWGKKIYLYIVRQIDEGVGTTSKCGNWGGGGGEGGCVCGAPPR